MPGITAWLSRDDTSLSERESCSSVSPEEVSAHFYDSVDVSKRTADYATSLVFDQDQIKIGETSYPSYPIRTVETDGLLVCLEGAIYGTEVTEGDLSTVGEMALRGQKGRLEEWVSSRDGEFVVYALDTDSGDFAVVNDVFGRLPLYVYERGGEVIVTRENEFLREFVEEISIDELGVAQCLLFGFTLGQRTIWEDVDKLRGGSLLRYPSGSQGRRERVHQFDFGDKQNRDRSIAHNADAAAESFTEACERRGAAATSTVVSLSGGLDSRSVAAGYRASGTPFEAVTFASGSDNVPIDSMSDVKVAQKVAEMLDVDWQRIDLSPPDTDDFRQLLSLKGGMNPFTNARTLSFFRRLREEYGQDVTYVTGDGGDKAIPDLSPPHAIADTDELVSHLMEFESIVFSLERVIRMTGVSEAEIRDSVASLIDAYPESDPAYCYVGYKIRERGFNWLNEGEDRNRAFFWSTTPFYSLPFFADAMSVPTEQKRHNQFYREFLKRLSPKATRIKDANFHVAMDSRLYPFVQRGLSFLASHPTVKRTVRPIYRREVFSDYDRNLAKLLLAQLRNSDGIRETLVEAEIARIGADRRSCNRQQIYNLITMTSAIADVSSGETMLDANGGMAFR
jgi:asparagine synthase (glutamine-hydrolysing)